MNLSHHGATDSSHAISAPLLAPAPSRVETLLKQGGLAVGGSLLVAVCAHLSVPLPFTPVPLTLSDLAVLLVGFALGPSTAFAALAFYLVEGAAGMPVFSPAGPGGVAQLLGPTGGYLLSYPLAAALTSALSRGLRMLGKTQRSSGNLLAALAGSALLMACGVLWLGFLAHLAPAIALSKGVLPFLPGQAVKIIGAAGIATTLVRARRSSSL